MTEQTTSQPVSSAAERRRVLEVDGVTLRFGGLTALDDVTLDIAQGEIFGVIGYSGAGKSTLVRLVNGLERATAGTVVVDGLTVSAMTEKQLRPVRADIGMIFQQFNLFSAKSVAENIAYPLRVAGWDKDRRRERVA